MAYIQKQLEEMSIEDFAKALALCLADETTFVGSDASEASLVTLAVAAERLDLADEFAAIEAIAFE